MVPGVAAAPRSPKARTTAIRARLAESYPGTAETLCPLSHDGTFQLLAATILSAQTTDARVNMVTPALFGAYPTAEALAAAVPEELEDLIRTTGFFRSKARNLIAMAGAVVERFGGAVPSETDDLVSLPGVGRKTANVVRSCGMGLPGLPVDTHVGRLARRLGLSAHTDPEDVERDLDALVPPEQWGTFSLQLILHGRAVCQARSPRCAECVLADLCPSAHLPTAAPAVAAGRSKRGR
jgi:endonuclease-3